MYIHLYSYFLEQTKRKYLISPMPYGCEYSGTIGTNVCINRQLYICTLYHHDVPSSIVKAVESICHFIFLYNIL